MTWYRVFILDTWSKQTLSCTSRLNYSKENIPQIWLPSQAVARLVIISHVHKCKLPFLKQHHLKYPARSNTLEKTLKVLELPYTSNLEVKLSQGSRGSKTDKILANWKKRKPKPKEQRKPKTKLRSSWDNSNSYTHVQIRSGCMVGVSSQQWVERSIYLQQQHAWQWSAPSTRWNHTVTNVLSLSQ